MERLGHLLNALALEVWIQVDLRPSGKTRTGITVEWVASH